MTSTELEALVKTLSVGPSFASLKLRFVAEYNPWSGGLGDVECYVPDRETGIDKYVSIGVELSLSMSKEEVVEKMYQKTKELVLHELDENFRVDGKLLHDPHPRIVFVPPPPRYMTISYEEATTTSDGLPNTPAMPLRGKPTKRGKIPQFLTMLAEPLFKRKRNEKAPLYRST